MHHFGIESSLVLLGLFAGLVVLTAIAHAAGVLVRILHWLNTLFLAFVGGGFRWWRCWLGWMPWPLTLAFLAAIHALIWMPDDSEGWPSLLGGLVLVVIGGSACLAYIFIDLERYQVGRGHKVFHNPVKGQVVADDLVRYGVRAGLPLLILATVATVSGFALLNQGLYNTIGSSWYSVGSQRWHDITPNETGAPPAGYADFLVYGILNILRIVDLVDVANTFNVVHLSYVHQLRWPASMLLLLFKAFFTMLLLQQLYAALRRFFVLGENIQDFWSPHQPVHQRAETALAQHGLSAVQPLLSSLRRDDLLTEAERGRLSDALASLGPGAVPLLLKHVRDPREDVRAVTLGTLGRLQALEVLPRLARVCSDPSESVRQTLVEALGLFCQRGPRHIEKAARLRQSRRWWWRWRWLRRVAANHTPVLDPAIDLLRQLCGDSAAAVRARAVAILGQLGTAAESAIPQIAHMLGDNDESVRCEAAEALGKIGRFSDETAAALMAMLAQPDPPVKIAAMHALSASREHAHAAVPHLLPLLQDRDEALRREAAEMLKGLGELSEATTPRLVAGLKSADNQVRAETAETLGEIGAPAADTVPALVRSLGDDSDRVRAKAAEALGKMGPAAAKACGALERALRDVDHRVAALAAEALGEIGHAARQASTGLCQALEHINADVRRQAAAALAKIQAEMGHAPDRDVVTALRRATRDADAAVRAQVLKSLAAVTDATACLLAALEDKNSVVRQAAVAALGDLGTWDQDVLAALARGLEDSNDAVQAEAARAVGKTGRATPAALKGLVRLLSNDTPAVESAAATALGKLGADAIEAGEPLLQLLRNGGAEVREQALRALALIQPPEAEQAFIAGLHDADPVLRKLASGGLLKIESLSANLLAALVEGLHDPDPQVRCNVAQVLERQKIVPESAIPALLEATSDSDDGLRLSALRALGHVSTPGMIPLLERVLTDSNAQVRLEAATQLLLLDPGHGEATEVMHEALASGQKRIVREAPAESHHSNGVQFAHLSRD